MKWIFLIVINWVISTGFFSFAISGDRKSKLDKQKIATQCSCVSNEAISELIDCKADTLSNGALVYWNYSCDSSWLIFENSRGEKQIIFSLDSQMIDLTGRIGHVYFYEYDRTFLFINKVISGCCEPVDYYLYDKKNGSLIEYLGRAIFVSENPNFPYFVSFENSGFQETEQPFNLDKIAILNLNTLQSKQIDIPTDVAENIMKFKGGSYPENIVKYDLESDSILKIHIPYTQNENDTIDLTHTVKINLKQF